MKRTSGFVSEPDVSISVIYDRSKNDSGVFSLGSVVREMHAGSTHVDTLVLRKLNLGYTELYALSEPLLSLLNLSVLNLSDNERMGEKGVGLLLDCLQANQLSQLMLSNCGLKAIPASELRRLLDSFPGLCTLDLSHNDLNAEPQVMSLALGISGHPSLKEVVLEDNYISPAGQVMILRLLATNTHMEQLKMSSKKSEKKNSKVVKLISCFLVFFFLLFSFFFLSFSFRSYPWMQRDKKLLKMDFVSAVKANISLIHLSCDLKQSQEIKIVMEQNELVREARRMTLNSMRSVDLSDRFLLCVPSLIYTLIHIHTLDLSDNNLSFLSSSVTNLRALTELNLENNDFDVRNFPLQVGSTQLLFCLPPLPCCFFNDSSQLRKNPRLKKLHVRKNPFLDHLPPHVASLPGMEIMEWLSEVTNSPTFSSALSYPSSRILPMFTVHPLSPLLFVEILSPTISWKCLWREKNRS